MFHPSFKIRVNTPLRYMRNSYKPITKAYISEQIIDNDGSVRNVFSIKDVDFSKKDVKVRDFELSNLLKVGFLKNAVSVSISPNSMNIVDNIKD